MGRLLGELSVAVWLGPSSVNRRVALKDSMKVEKVLWLDFVMVQVNVKR